MGTVLRPVYDNNTTLDSFRDAAQLYDGQLLTFYEARLLCLCLGVDLQPIYETFLFKDSDGVSWWLYADYRTFLLRKRKIYFFNCVLSETVARSSIHS